MKVLFDHQIFSYQQYGGVSRYFYELLKHLPRDKWSLSIFLSNNEYLKALKKDCNLRYLPFFPDVSFHKKERLMLELGKPYSQLCRMNKDYDILHITHYESFGLNKVHTPIVMTYHDKLFSSYAKNERTVKQQKKCLENVHSVIAISENTKKDFLSIFDFPSENVHVIYHGVNKEISKMNRIHANRYVLYVGARLHYKNFSTFLNAMHNIMIEDKDLLLVCTGNPFSLDEMRQFVELGIADRCISGFVSDLELSSLYQHAEAYVFPSKYEGFGMPLLEAMANSCPVICSDAHCFPEIAGNAAAYFDPDSVESITCAIRNVIYSPERSIDLIEKGKKRIELFSWEKCAVEHYNLYQSILNIN
jgi:glycosyltransferase involved in cell wall biosynthesis